MQELYIHLRVIYHWANMAAVPAKLLEDNFAPAGLHASISIAFFKGAKKKCKNMLQMLSLWLSLAKEPSANHSAWI